MLLQEKQLSDFFPIHLNFPDSQAGQSLIALLNVVVHFSERRGKYNTIIINFQMFFKKNAKKCEYRLQHIVKGHLRAFFEPSSSHLRAFRLAIVLEEASNN